MKSSTKIEPNKSSKSRPNNDSNFNTILIIVIVIIIIIVIVYLNINPSKKIPQKDDTPYHFQQSEKYVLNPYYIDEEMSNNNKNLALLRNFNDSCYIDSLMMFIYISSDSTIRDIIFNSYTSEKNITDVNINDNDIGTELYKIQLQNQMIEDYCKIYYTSDNFYCKKFRNLLASRDSHMANGMFNVRELYDHLKTLYPHTELNNTLYSMWEFIEDQTELNPSIITTDWDSVDSNILVFYNGVLPHVDDWTSFTTHMFINEYTGEIINRKQKKIFGQTILNGKYVLTGIIINTGLVDRKNKNGGSHYFAVIKLSDGEYYIYNDITPSLVKIVYSDDLFYDTIKKRPELCFYQKVY